MDKQETVITTRGLSRTFGTQRAVDDLTITVRQGEIFGLVGPDGAGKTTTLRLLTGIMLPTSGTATVVGSNVVENAEDVKGHIGYMAQQFSLYEDLTVLENLRFFADIQQVSPNKQRERIPKLLHFARLERFSDRQAGRLSGGMQKKLALACTLIHRPSVVYLDEPTTGVDPVSRREFWDILGDLHLEGITIVVTTPYMDEAERCSRVGLMFEGRLIDCDLPERIQSRVPGDLLELQPDDLNGTVNLVESLPGVREVQTYGELLHVFVEDAEEQQKAIREAMNGAGHHVVWMRRTTPRMEEAFIHLIRKERERH